MSDRLREEILREINDAWLNINVKNSEIIRPLNLMDCLEPEQYYLGLTYLMSQPEYFSFLCKHILNIDILPFQGLILSECWKRKFPMLVGSRGMGKAIRLTEPILTDKGWVLMGDITYEHKIYGRDGNLHNITGIYPQGKLRVCEIRLSDGRMIECCEDHLWLVKVSNVEKTLSTKEIIQNGIIKGDLKKYSYKFKLPLCEPIQYTEQNLPIDPYILGCLIGDGCLTTLTPKIASSDEFIIQEFRKKLKNFEIKRDATNNSYTIVDLDSKQNIYQVNHKTSKHRNSLTGKIKELGLDVCSYEKFIPDIYKYSTVEHRLEILRGLMDTDGSITKSGAIEFSNTSKRLIDDIVDILRSLGIACRVSSDNREGQTHIFPNGKSSIRNKYYRVFINTSLPIFKLPRKLNRLKKKSTSREKYVSIIEAKYTDRYEDMQCISVDSEDRTYIIKDYIVTHNSFILSLYCLLRAALIPNRKIVVVGAAFRQSKILYEYMENIWKNAPILRDMCDSNSRSTKDPDECRMILNNSIITCLPIGDGQKIRGKRANDIIADEFSSQSRPIFETVIAGFAAVSASPALNVRNIAAKRKAKELNVELEELGLIQEESKGNQIIISGTAYYDFNHFAEYYRRWKVIVNSKGDKNKLKEIFGDEEIPESFNWRDYAIFRIPVNLIPKGFMDDAQIARSKATIHSGIYQMEYGAVFAKDSQGFFKRSLIESCVASEEKNILLPSGPVCFDPMLKGNLNLKYVMGIDPASEVDNFSICIVEIRPDHRRIVYNWTTNKKEHIEKMKAGITNQNNFYSYCARKIRDLMNLFPIARICMDSQGGGVAVREALHDETQINAGELPIWEIIDPDKEKETDDKAGLHILEMCNFANYEWLSEANHGMRKDFEDKLLLFPRFDPVTIAVSIEEDKVNNRLYDTLEDCIMEIEQLKRELSMIEITKSVNGRDRWDTPEVKLTANKKERLRKDRYSALLMANAGARVIANTAIQAPYVGYGGFAEMLSEKPKFVEYSGPEWFVSAIKGVY